MPLKYLSNFWGTPDIPLIICKVSLALSWCETCVINSIENESITTAERTNPEQRDNPPTNATFSITDCKLYVVVVTLSAENDNKLLEQLKTGFKRTIRWNKYRPEIV